MDGIIWLPYDEHLWEIDRSGDIHVVILSIEKRQEEEAWPWPVKFFSHALDVIYVRSKESIKWKQS